MNHLDLAKELALQAGAMMLKGLENKESLEIREKSPADFVTNIDIAIEQMVRERLLLETPDFGILGEEGAGNPEDWKAQLDKQYCWVLDPLDGTANFASFMPHFAFSLALLKQNEPILGVVFDCSRNELFYAEKGKGAFLNHSQIFIGKKNNTNNSIVAVGLSSTSSEYLEANKFWYTHLLNQFAKIRSLGASALDLCWLASGRIDAFFQINIKPWDVAAAAIIIEEAGGSLCSLGSNSKKDFSVSSGSIFASNKALFEKFFKEIENYT